VDKISKFILNIILGWEVENGFPQTPKKYVVIAAPHTSWLDFPIAILARFSENTMVHFVGKSSLFKWPFGYFFKSLGGTPIDRSKTNNMVEAVIDTFNKKQEFRLALAPEGTRKKVTKWKTGFYYIAKGANVPIVMATLDFENKKVKISKPFYVTENIEQDFEVFKSFFKNVKGKNPELS
jgi:1-acyl-sn-glycerol-3-phosphate acyltransferase